MYEIIGHYEGESEVLDSTEDRHEAEYLRREYQLAYGDEWQITIRRVKP